MLKKENLSNARMIYKTGIRLDFPSAERMPYTMFKRAVKNKLMKVYGYYVENKRCGYVVTLEEDGVIFILYFAVNRNLRDNGYGSNMMEEVKKFLKDKKYLVLEADSSEGVTDKKELEIIKRRKQFYYNNKFSEVQNIKYCLYGVNCDLLYYLLNIDKIENYEVIEDIKKIYNKLNVDMKYFDVEVF